VGDGSLSVFVAIIWGSAGHCLVFGAAMSRLVVAAVSTVYSHVKLLCWLKCLSCVGRASAARGSKRCKSSHLLRQLVLVPSTSFGNRTEMTGTFASDGMQLLSADKQAHWAVHVKHTMSPQHTCQSSTMLCYKAATLATGSQQYPSMV
jgi:hypothetical protein